jgi:hypothetical protein
MIVAVTIAIVALIFNCQTEGKSLVLANGRQAPMKCYYTAMAEVATAASLLILGALLFLAKHKETARNLGILGLALGSTVMLLPTYLIGVCADHAASCNLVMRPAMLLAGAIVLVVSSIPLFTYQSEASAPA